jgi:hypothetical protein
MDTDYVPFFPAAKMNRFLKPPSKPVSPSLCYTTHVARSVARAICYHAVYNLLAVPTPKSNRQPLPAPDAVRNVRIYSVQYEEHGTFNCTVHDEWSLVTSTIFAYINYFGTRACDHAGDDPSAIIQLRS